MIKQELVGKVIGWFRENGRILPWREGRDPYRIWLSEVMLQQTRIEAVIPYYHRFLKELPTVFDLAACPEEKLLKLWEGLGYYSRARNLKKAAEIIVEKWNGQIPGSVKELRSLPGIGDYTAGAISSIAFGQPSPAVDGNVLRVLTRVTGDFSDIALASTKKTITEELSCVYPSGKDAGDLTEGIMEIGERICIPNGVPLCSVCPLKELCIARKKDLITKLPVKSPKAERKQIEMTVFILSCEDKYALRKRETGGLLGGMWEFYHTPGHLSPEKALDHLKEAGFQPLSLAPAGRAKHIFTHLEWHMQGYFVSCEMMLDKGLAWKTKEDIRENFALPGAFHPFLKKMESEKPGN